MQKRNKGGLSGRTVEVRNGNIEAALRRLGKIVQDEKIIKQVKEKAYYEKPSDKKKREKAAARKRWFKRLYAAERANYSNQKRR